ncbi:MAG: TIGR00266 family protein [Verrucomicrobiota bacterium]
MSEETATSEQGLDYRIEASPDFSFLIVRLPAGQTIKVEASGMATMDTSLTMKTKMRGGLSRMLSGESLFINEFSAGSQPGEIGIAPPMPGDLDHVYLNNTTLYLQNSAFVASGPDVEIESKWQGFTKGFFSGESMFLIRCSGVGDLWFNTFGAIIPIDVTDEFIVDTGHIVAFTEGLEYRISRMGGYKSLIFSGEGFVCRFSGEGRVWIQTRKLPAFTAWINPYRRVKKSKSN